MNLTESLGYSETEATLLLLHNTHIHDRSLSWILQAFQYQVAGVN
jgi:hypothetical protein